MTTWMDDNGGQLLALEAIKGLAPREVETDINKAPVVRAVTALLMVIAVLSSITRLTTKVITVRSMKIDDHLLLGATVVAVIQSILVIAEGATGLGRYQSDLQDSQVMTVLKLEYCASILFTLCMALAKVSATRTLFIMSPRSHSLGLRALEVVIGLWALSSIAATVFQCKLPETWKVLGGRDTCINRSYLWLFINTMNAATDMAIVIVMFDIFRNVQTSQSKKTLVIGVFGSRILNIPPMILHIYYFDKAIKSGNYTFEMWSPMVIMQVIVCLSVFTTCVPNLKPFLDSVESGQMHAGDLRQTRSRSSVNRSNNHLTGRSTKRGRGGISGSTLGLDSHDSSSSRYQKILELEEMDARLGKQRGTTTSATATAAFEPSGAAWDGQSYTSQTVLVQQSWRVDVERSNAAGAVANGVVRS